MTATRAIALSAVAAFVIAFVTAPGRLVRLADLRPDRADHGPRPARELRQVRGAAVRRRLQGLRLLSQRGPLSRRNAATKPQSHGLLRATP